MQSSRDARRILEAARAAYAEERATDVAMPVQRLSQAPRWAFWTQVRGGYASYRGRGFGSVEEVLAEAIENLAALDAGDTIEVPLAEQSWGAYRHADYFVRRGRYRVDIMGLPAWMRRDFATRARVVRPDGVAR